MFDCIIMRFLDRSSELERLDRLVARGAGGLAVVYGRRRLGKTRLLLEWARRHAGLYTVADLSAPDVQRRYFATAISERLPGFADVEYPDWARLLARLAREAKAARFRGPIIFDELPYLVTASPELPSVLQAFVDHEAKSARLVVAIAGSSQRMMQGLVLDGNAPLYGRAREILRLGPIEPAFFRHRMRSKTVFALVEHYAAWGGVPWYWELALDAAPRPRDQIERLVLDPLGPLHQEPDRLLLEEMPVALEVRPLLDAIGSGAHRVSEIAGRLGRPATSLSRPLERLVSLGLVRREVPFGESERRTKKSLYRIDDPFFRMWFRVVAPHRALLASSTRSEREQLLGRHYPQLLGAAWEELCRAMAHRLSSSSPVAERGPWGPASRWWSGTRPEWDLVSRSHDGRRLLLGEARWASRPLRRSAVERATRELAAKPPPVLAEGRAHRESEIVRVLFVPATVRATVGASHGVWVVTGEEMFGG